MVYPNNTSEQKIKLSNAGQPYLKLKSSDILRALESRHPRGTRTVFLTELAFGTGFSRGSDNHIDAMAFNCWPSDGLTRTAYEIKVSREDFKRELRNPSKRENAVRFSNEFYIAAPKGLIHTDDLPRDSGLLEVDINCGWKIAKNAPLREKPEYDYLFFISALRNSQGFTINRQQRLKNFQNNMLEVIHGFPKEPFFYTDKEYSEWFRKRLEGE